MPMVLFKKWLSFCARILSTKKLSIQVRCKSELIVNSLSGRSPFLAGQANCVFPVLPSSHVHKLYACSNAPMFLYPTLPCPQASSSTCSRALKIPDQHAPMHSYIHVPLPQSIHAHKLTEQHAPIVSCSHHDMFPSSHAPKVPCSHAPMPLPPFFLPLFLRCFLSYRPSLWLVLNVRSFALSPLDLRDVIIQALAAFVCYPDSLAAMESMPEAL